MEIDTCREAHEGLGIGGFAFIQILLVNDAVIVLVLEDPFDRFARLIILLVIDIKGIGVVTDPGFSFFETAKPFAKEFMLRREGRAFRKLILDKLTGRENGDSQIAWSRVWKLTKMAAKMYLDR